MPKFRAAKICQKLFKIADVIDFNDSIFCSRTFSLIKKDALKWPYHSHTNQSHPLTILSKPGDFWSYPTNNSTLRWYLSLVTNPMQKT